MRAVRTRRWGGWAVGAVVCAIALAAPLAGLAQSACAQLGVDCSHHGSAGPPPCDINCVRARIDNQRELNRARQDAADAQLQGQIASYQQREQAAIAAGNYSDALSLALARQQLANGPNIRAFISWLRGQVALQAGNKRLALQYFKETLGAWPQDAQAVADFERWVDAEDLAARVASAKAAAEADVQRRRAELEQNAGAADRAAAAQASADARLAAYRAGASDSDPAIVAAIKAAGGMVGTDPSAQAETTAGAGRAPVIVDGRSYAPAGQGLIGGTRWITGYNVQNADPALVAKAHAMMAEQMRLAGLPYADGVDFDRYNFVLGIAASTNTAVDLATRVVFDEYKNGQYTAENQAGYDGLKGRQFDELACHSNGAMICLAALENRDVVADKVVLYGPQITAESLQMWDQLVRDHRVGSVQIYVNSGDPVPPLSLAIGGGMVNAEVIGSLALFHPPSFVDVIHETAPRLTVQTFACSSSPDLNCHGMEVYKANLAKHGCGPGAARSGGERVPGTALPGRPETANLAPPLPC